MSHRFWVRKAAILLLVVAAACNSTPEDVAGQYASVDEMREVVETAGFECVDWRPLTEVEPINAVEIATCTSTVVFSTHTNSAQVRVFVDNRAETVTELTDKDSVALVGVNWSVNCNLDECGELQAMLGGEIEVTSP